MLGEMEALSPEQASYREAYREAEIGPRYSGWGHFAFTTLGSLSAIAYAASRLSAVRPLEWALVPIFFLIANLGEYFGHRGPMHHRRRGLDLLFKRHTLQHHRFFTREAMACESPRDFKIMLFPPVMLVFFIGCLATPIALGFALLVSPNAGWLFAVVAVSYFLLYEWLHFAYHLPADGTIGRLPVVGTLRRHHQLHHDAALMADWNFNITFPIADALFGTTYRERNGQGGEREEGGDGEESGESGD
jgi:sterol desaturase/sphingolipid hydroxylase (fatty acid hydroxylase superfamily)